MELIGELQAWHWFVLALALFALEVFTTSGFFIGIAAASLLLSLILWLAPALPWEWQLATFGVLSVALTLGYFRFFKGVNQRTDNPLLNDRAAQLIGHRFTLEQDLAETGAVMINDTRWQARTAVPLVKGTAVQVTGSDGMTLVIAAAEH